MNFNLNDGLWWYIVNKCFNSQMSLDPTHGDFISIILMTVGFTVVTILVAYLLGSINSAIIISKMLYGDDIRTHGSGNAGATNMLRTFGLRAAILTLVGDMLKTAIAIFIGGALGGFTYANGIAVGFSGYNFGIPLTYVAGIFAIIGHILPVFYKFKGGKGVLCTATMALILNPIEFAILIALFIAIVCMSKYVSLGSVCAAVLYPVLVCGHIRIFAPPLNGFVALITVIIAIIVVYCHRENLKRISNGTEKKISIGGNKKENGDAEK